MTMGMATTAFAADPITSTADDNGQAEDGTGTLNVKYQLDENYEVTIPSDVTIKYENEEYSGSDSVKADKVLVQYGRSLQISVKSDTYNSSADDDYKYSLVNSDNTDSPSTISYSIAKGEGKDAVANEGTILEVKAADEVSDGVGYASDEVKLTFSTTEDKVKEAIRAGAHTDKLTFTIKVADEIEE
jgi:hypothetical protein